MTLSRQQTTMSTQLGQSAGPRRTASAPEGKSITDVTLPQNTDPHVFTLAVS